MRARRSRRRRNTIITSTIMRRRRGRGVIAGEITRVTVVVRGTAATSTACFQTNFANHKNMYRMRVQQSSSYPENPGVFLWSLVRGPVLFWWGPFYAMRPLFCTWGIVGVYWGPKYRSIPRAHALDCRRKLAVECLPPRYLNGLYVLA